MSYILIDAGNSCLKLSILEDLDGSELFFTIIDYSNLYNDLTAEIKDCVVNDVFICSVANPAVFHTIYDVVYELWRLEPRQLIVEQDSHGLSTRYENPRLLGSDRWAAMIAARAEFDDTLCVVDCGTAVTIDVVSSEGMHLGGLITPGLQTSRDSLGLKASNLPFVDMDDVEKKTEKHNNRSSFLALKTQDAILVGTLYEISAYIERIVSEIKHEFGENTECIITGGDAVQVQSLILHQFHHREALVLDGLRIVAKNWLNKESI